ncbi:MAG: sulfatase [Armatimonadota bacterium]|nr:sulfatase [Armatimonadota bacterium]
MKKQPNLIFFGIDSLRADHMSLYGYHRLTTPHMDKLAAGGASFEKAFSPHIPTTPGYSNMFTGMDCFGTDVVALRHEGPLADHVKTLAEILAERGYNNTCVGFGGNPASKGFENYLSFSGWGSWEEGRSHKAENLNDITIPELKRLAEQDAPFFLFMRHMDPHSPYLPPLPFERMFYGGNELDENNRSLDPVYDFAPFANYFRSWFPPGCTDKDYIIAQYDGALAYMDACIANIFATIKTLGLEDDTLIVINSDHGETLYDHDCYFDHHSIYDPTLHVPLIFHQPGKVPAGTRVSDYCQVKDVTPTILDLMGIDTGIKFDGRSLVPLMRGAQLPPGLLRRLWRGLRLAPSMRGAQLPPEEEFYITEATWMRKHGWRTPEWKLIHALEPDFHFKPEVELYNLIDDPEEYNNLAEKRPDVVAELEAKMQAHIAKRESETGRTNPMYTNLNWNGHGKPFESSQEAYDTLYIGSPITAKDLQAKELKTQRGQDEL